MFEHVNTSYLVHRFPYWSHELQHNSRKHFAEGTLVLNIWKTSHKPLQSVHRYTSWRGGVWVGRLGLIFGAVHSSTCTSTQIQSSLFTAIRMSSLNRKQIPTRTTINGLLNTLSVDKQSTANSIHQCHVWVVNAHAWLFCFPSALCNWKYSLS